MNHAVADDGVPLQLGIDGGVAHPLQQLLDRLQTGVHTDTQAQQPVPGGLAPPGEDLMEVDLAHSRPPGQLRLGQAASLIELRQKRGYVRIREMGFVLCDILVQVGLAHQLLAQIVGGFLPHILSTSLYFFRGSRYNIVIIVQNHPAKYNMPAA